MLYLIFLVHVPLYLAYRLPDNHDLFNVTDITATGSRLRRGFGDNDLGDPFNAETYGDPAPPSDDSDDGDPGNSDTLGDSVSPTPGDLGEGSEDVNPGDASGGLGSKSLFWLKKIGNMILGSFKQIWNSMQNDGANRVIFAFYFHVLILFLLYGTLVYLNVNRYMSMVQPPRNKFAAEFIAQSRPHITVGEFPFEDSVNLQDLAEPDSIVDEHGILTDYSSTYF